MGVSVTRTNNLYLVIGALMIAVIGLSFYVYREETKPKGVELSIGQNGIKLQEN
jgi:RsiW-degrading membrane proteinase PrsW (M82 family)